MADEETGIHEQRSPSLGSLPDVAYHLELDGVDARWGVRTVTLREGVGEPFRGIIEALADGAPPEPAALMGKRFALRLERGDQLRIVRGLVRQATVVELVAGPQFTLHVVPVVWQLAINVDTRTHRDTTVPDLVRAVVRERLGVCVLDERRRLRCAGEDPDPTIDLPAPLQRGIVDATNARGHLCAIDEARALWCFEANDYAYPDDLQHRWYRRLDPPVEGLFEDGNAFCARRSEDVVCRGIRPQPGLSETPVSDDRPQHAFYSFVHALRPGEELVILDQLCVLRASGKLACPEPLARRLGPQWAVEVLE